MNLGSRPAPLLSSTPSSQSHLTPSSHIFSLSESDAERDQERDDSFVPLSPHSPLSDASLPDFQQSSFTSSLPIEYVSGMTSRSRVRRGSVSAESDPPPFAPSRTKIKIAKSAAQIERIQAATRSSILFSGLDRSQQEEIIDAMSELPVKAGTTVISQGEPGDFFYIVERGVFDVYRDETKVFEYVEKGSFGELALMYMQPRAASVKARSDGCLWRTDRETFRHIVIASTAKKRALLEQALESVPLLANLCKQERAHVADALETVTYRKGDFVIRQGEVGDSMHFVLSGEAKATQTPQNFANLRSAIEVGRIREGDYFGERALLTREPRAANIVVTSDELQVALMDLSAFERLLGSVKDIMTRHIRQYVRAEDLPSEDEEFKHDIPAEERIVPNNGSAHRGT